MAIKKYIKINGWDILDEFFEKELKGIHINVEKSFGRAFCRCGETFASDGNVHKCPKCGNIEFELYQTQVYDDRPVSCSAKYSKEETLSPYSYKVYEHQLFGEPNKEREVINFTIKKVLIVELHEKEIFDYSGKRLGHTNYPLGNNYNEILKGWKYLTKLNPFLEGNSSYYYTTYISQALDMFNYFEKTIEDDLYIQYSKLGYNVLKYLYKQVQTISFGKNLPLKDYLNMLDIDEEFLNVYDRLCGGKHWDKNGIFRKFYKEGASWRDAGVIIYKELQDKKKENSFGYKLVSPYIINGVLDLEVGLNLIYKINNEQFISSTGEDIKELFKTYFKENIVIKNEGNIVFSFLRDIEILENMKIPLTKENLKLKNMNYFLEEYE